MTFPLATDLDSSARTSALIDGPMLVEDEQELSSLQECLLYPDRTQPVVALALCEEETDEIALWHEEVRPIVGEHTQVYFIAPHLLGSLREGLGRKLTLLEGSARIWWPGLSTRSDPGDHPLVLALEGESRIDVLAEFARQFDLSRPHVRRELKLIEDARLAEIVEQDQRTAERLRDAHRERHREATRAQAAETRLDAALTRLAECGCEEPAGPSAAPIIAAS
jgi:DNA-binding transcriptional ArsR family regulator